MISGGRRLALLPLTLLALVGPSGPDHVVAPRHAPAETPYARLLNRHAREATIEGIRVRALDYGSIRRDPDYARALAELAAARPQAMTRDERLAYWVNAYNLLAIRLVADRYPVGSILDVEAGGKGAWQMPAGTAGGRVVSLDEIVERLRREFREPRIHFALVAAAVSCPDVRAYDAAGLDEQLDEAARAFLANDRRGLRADGERVAVSRLLHGHHADFEPTGLISFLRAHAPAAAAARLEGARLHDLAKLPYEWGLNDLARADASR